MAKTPGAAQRRWRVPSEFPCCPHEVGAEPIITYADNLKAGAIFAHNNLTKSAVLEIAIANDRQSIWVMVESREEGAVKPWALAQITYENGLYVHTSLGTFSLRKVQKNNSALRKDLNGLAAIRLMIIASR